MPLPPLTMLGRYEIRSLLGTGGMGEVYLAYDTQLRRQVAIKLLPTEFTQNKARLSRFEREAYAASSLNHPNILTIHEIGEQDGHHFIATEYAVIIGLLLIGVISAVGYFAFRFQRQQHKADQFDRCSSLRKPEW